MTIPNQKKERKPEESILDINNSIDKKCWFMLVKGKLAISVRRAIHNPKTFRSITIVFLEFPSIRYQHKTTIPVQLLYLIPIRFHLHQNYQEIWAKNPAAEVSSLCHPLVDVQFALYRRMGFAEMIRGC